MSDQPITTPPKRRDQPDLSHIYDNFKSSESCKNTPNISRKMDHHHHRSLLDCGTQSASSSPLPHRRLDKLEGVIRDKQSPFINRRRITESDDCSCSENSPLIGRKFEIKTTVRRNTECSCIGRPNDSTRSPIMSRRRVDSDCSCARKFSLKQSEKCKCSNSSCENTPLMRKKDIFSSPAKSILGEPGVFSSPIHKSDHSNFSGFGSPIKSVLGEPGVFASPHRSICASPCDENITAEIPLQPDQTIVSGWLKFRDNKRVSLDFYFCDFLTIK